MRSHRVEHDWATELIVEDILPLFIVEYDIIYGFVICGLCYVQEDSFFAQILEFFFKLCYSVTQSCPTLCDPVDCMQHARPPCPLPSPRVCPSSCPLHRSCHPAISASNALFSSALNLSQYQARFQWVTASSDQNTGTSASTSVLPMRIHGWFPLTLIGLISLLP